MSRGRSGADRSWGLRSKTRSAGLTRGVWRVQVLKTSVAAIVDVNKQKNLVRLLIHQDSSSLPPGVLVTPSSLRLKLPSALPCLLLRCSGGVCHGRVGGRVQCPRQQHRVGRLPRHRTRHRTGISQTHACPSYEPCSQGEQATCCTLVEAHGSRLCSVCVCVCQNVESSNCITLLEEVAPSEEGGEPSLHVSVTMPSIEVPPHPPPTQARRMRIYIKRWSESKTCDSAPSIPIACPPPLYPTH